MKIFWSIMALLVVGLSVAFLLPTNGAQPGEASPTAAQPSAMPAMTGMTEMTEMAEMQSMAPMPSMPNMTESPPMSEMEHDDAPAASSQSTEIAADDAPAFPQAGMQDEVPAPSESLGHRESIPEEAAQAASVTWDDILGSIGNNPTPSTTADAPTAAEVTPAAEVLVDADTAEAAPTPAVQAPAGQVPAEQGLALRELPDGTTLVNERFTLAGRGTKEAPYEITWDYLTSARESYLPRDGKTTIPPHISMLDGTYVRIGGYLQFPLATPEPKELLVMLNQWDGCCIGVPPTPYDAIEVSLSGVATRGEKFAVEGSLIGKLKIDPYLVGDWLIGLYLIGDATLDVSGSRSAEEVYGNTPTVGDPNAMPGG